MVPLVGAGVVTLEQIFPFTIGANIGTTVTAMLAALSTGSDYVLLVDDDALPVGDCLDTVGRQDRSQSADLASGLAGDNHGVAGILLCGDPFDQRRGRLHIDFGYVNEDGFWPQDDEENLIVGSWEREDGIWGADWQKVTIGELSRRYAVAVRRHDAAHRVLAHAHVENVRIRRGDRDRADGSAG